VTPGEKGREGREGRGELGGEEGEGLEGRKEEEEERGFIYLGNFRGRGEQKNILSNISISRFE